MSRLVTLRPVDPQSGSPYTPVPIDTLERLATDCEIRSFEPTLPEHERLNLARQAESYRAAVKLENEHRAQCQPYSLAEVIRDHESSATREIVKALLLGAAAFVVFALIVLW